MTLFSGKCEGGPFHGKSLYHGAPWMDIAMRGSKVVTYFGDPKTTPGEEIKYGTYQHKDGAWIWKAPVSE
jgi:hypothetical protein